MEPRDKADLLHAMQTLQRYGLSMAVALALRPWDTEQRSVIGQAWPGEQGVPERPVKASRGKPAASMTRAMVLTDTGPVKPADTSGKPVWITAKYPGTCITCGQPFAAGEQIAGAGGWWSHASHYPKRRKQGASMKTRAAQIDAGATRSQKPSGWKRKTKRGDGR